MIENNVAGILKRSKLFQGLGDDEIENICSLVRPSETKYQKNQVIVSQGESVRKIGILKKGTVVSTKYHLSGNAQILRLYHQGEVLLLDAVSTTFSTSPVTLISQSDSTLLFVPYMKIFDGDTVSAETKKVIMSNSSEILSNELIRLMYKIDVLSKRTLQERILTYLSLICEKNGSRTFDLGMNQEQFAQYLCVNRSVLSKELNLMRKNGTIDYKGKRFTLC